MNENKTETIDHDARILEIQKVIKSLGVESKTREEFKNDFKSQGYEDDECDLGYELVNAKLQTGPFSYGKTMIILTIITVLLIVFARSFLGFILILIYFAYIQIQRTNYFKKILLNDFGARKLEKEERDHLIKKWEENKSYILDMPEGKMDDIFEIEYDKRKTYWADYHYVIGSGKHKKIIELLITVQSLKRPLPPIHCYRKSMQSEDIWHWAGNVEMESVEFNKKYNTRFLNHGEDAFYVLNPRVMVSLLEEKHVEKIKFMEILGSEVMVGSGSLKIGGKIRAKGPIIKYDEYKKAKDQLIACLDIMTNVNDVLAREIVDDGSQRHTAKMG